jgi:hypothetical protein
LNAQQIKEEKIDKENGSALREHVGAASEPPFTCSQDCNGFAASPKDIRKALESPKRLS